MQGRKEYILDKAFEVFIKVGYDSASMTVLQQELKMSRGAMYRHYKSKDDLFRAVIDKYVFRRLDYYKSADLDSLTVPERIEKDCHLIQTGLEIIVKVSSTGVKFLNFTALLIQAAKVYPGFMELIWLYAKSRRNGWIKAIENSIAKGEIRPDINVEIVAALFSEAASPKDRIDEVFNGSSGKVNKPDEVMNYIYSLVKT
jgi:AcrR family transcriptional regulator